MKENVKFEKKKKFEQKMESPIFNQHRFDSSTYPLFLYLIFINNLEIFPYILTPTQIK